MRAIANRPDSTIRAVTGRLRTQASTIRHIHLTTGLSLLHNRLSARCRTRFRPTGFPLPGTPEGSCVVENMYSLQLLDMKDFRFLFPKANISDP